MLKISLSLFLAIFALVPLAAAQNSNKAVKTSGAVNKARTLTNADVNSGVEPEPANSTVRGRVYYEDTGRAVKRASLILVRAEGGPGEASGLTDANGEFIFRKVKAGTYYAMINAPGIVTPLAYLDFSRIQGGEKEAMEEAVLNFEKIVVDGVNELNVQIPAKRGGAVSGRIIYENGDPAIGVRVEVLRKLRGKFVPVFSNLSAMFGMFSGFMGNGQTDDRGVYRFAGLPTGEYVVKATESASHTEGNERSPGMGGFEALFGTNSLLTFYFPEATDVKDAQILNVLMGQELGEINLTIPDKSVFALSGKVVSARDKKPLTGARVSLKRSGDNVLSIFSDFGRRNNTAVTDEEGDWNFKEIPRGDYQITVEPAGNSGEYGYHPYNSNFNANVGMARPRTPPEPKYAKKFQDLKVEDKDLADIIIELGFGATVSGTVAVENNKEMPSYIVIAAVGENDEALISTSVNNSDEGGEEDPRPLQKSNNSFRLENISAGKVKFKFSLSDDDYYVKSARAGMTDLMTGTVDLKEGDILSNVKIVLANDPGTLKGKVTDSKDKPASGVSLLLVSTDAAKKGSPNFFKTVRSDAEGKFEIKLAPGEYAIVLLKTEAAEMKQADFGVWLDEATKNAAKVSIDAEKTSTVTFKMPAQ